MTKAEFKTALTNMLPAYLRITVDTSETALIGAIAGAAASFLEDGVGSYIPWDDDKTMMLALAVVSDMYDNRTLSSTQRDLSTAVRNTTRQLMQDFSQQLRLRAAVAKEEAEADAS